VYKNVMRGGGGSFLHVLLFYFIFITKCTKLPLDFPPYDSYLSVMIKN
jgi:hypothetical protein